LKIKGAKKLSEMDELKMVPVNIFFHLKQKRRVKWFKVASFLFEEEKDKKGM